MPVWKHLHTPARTLGELAVMSAAGQLLASGVTHVLRSNTARNLAVGVVADGIVLSRWLGGVAEEARLWVGDLRAEALSVLGEQAPPPTAPGADHDGAGHEHGL